MILKQESKAWIGLVWLGCLIGMLHTPGAAGTVGTANTLMGTVLVPTRQKFVQVFMNPNQASYPVTLLAPAQSFLTSGMILPFSPQIQFVNMACGAVPSVVGNAPNYIYSGPTSASSAFSGQYFWGQSTCTTCNAGTVSPGIVQYTDVPTGATILIMWTTDFQNVQPSMMPTPSVAIQVVTGGSMPYTPPQPFKFGSSYVSVMPNQILVVVGVSAYAFNASSSPYFANTGFGAATCGASSASFSVYYTLSGLGLTGQTNPYPTTGTILPSTTSCSQTANLVCSIATPDQTYVIQLLDLLLTNEGMASNVPLFSATTGGSFSSTPLSLGSLTSTNGGSSQVVSDQFQSAIATFPSACSGSGVCTAIYAGLLITVNPPVTSYMVADPNVYYV